MPRKMGANQEFIAKYLQACQEYQKNLTTPLEPLEWLKPYLLVEDSTSYLICDAYEDPGVLAPKYDEDLVLGDFPLDVDLTSRELCMREDEEEVGKLTHELHIELSLTHSSSFQSSMADKTYEDVSGTYGLIEEPLVMVKHEEHSDLHGLDERYGLEISDYTHSLHLGDHEPLILGSPLTAQFITVDGGVEHIPCGPTIRDVYAHTYCGNGYIEDVDISVWDCVAIPSERLLDREFEHTIEFGLSRGEKLIDELHRVAYSLKIDLQLGYHQTTSECHYGHYEFLVKQLGLINILSTFQSRMNPIFSPQLQGFMLVFLDYLLIHNRTWEDHLRQLDETWGMMESIFRHGTEYSLEIDLQSGYH